MGSVVVNVQETPFWQYAAPVTLGAPAGAEPDRVKREIEDVIGLDTSNCLLASAKKASRPRLALDHAHMPPAS